MKIYINLCAAASRRRELINNLSEPYFSNR